MHKQNQPTKTLGKTHQQQSKKAKKQINWKKTFANITNKGLKYLIYKEVLKIEGKKKTKNPIAKDMKR